jgi:hypothetical protein
MVAEVADVSAVAAAAEEDAGTTVALVITIVAPGILKLVRSEHFVDVCEEAIVGTSASVASQ